MPTEGRQFLGRRDELTAIEQAVADARAGRPSVLLLSGDAGIGKSTLITEAATRTGAAMFMGRSAQLGGEVVALAPLVDLLRQVQRARPELLAGEGGTDDAAGSLRDWLSPTTVADGGVLDGLFVPVLELLGRLSDDGPVIVGIEDLHWADSATWDLFELLARNLADEAVLLVGTIRSKGSIVNAAQRRRLAELTRLERVRRIDLSGLTRDDVAARIAALTGGTVDAAVVDRIFQRSEGNPFFTDELAAAHLQGDEIPEVLSDLISADLDALDERSRELLDVMAVFGSEAPHALLAEAAELTDADVEAAVRAPIDARLVVIDRGTDAYRFRHALIGEVVYDQLLPSKRKRLHRRIADTLSLHLADATFGLETSGRLAFHLDKSGDHAAAFTALLTAADAAEAVAPAVALEQLERALELWDQAAPASDHEHRGARLWQAAELASGAIGNDRGVELARTAFTFGTPPRGAAWGHERLGRFLWASGRLAESEVEFRLAAEQLDTDASAPGSVAATAGLGQAALMNTDFAAARTWSERVLADPSAHADQPGRVGDVATRARRGAGEQRTGRPGRGEQPRGRRIGAHRADARAGHALPVQRTGRHRSVRGGGRGRRRRRVRRPPGRPGPQLRHLLRRADHGGPGAPRPLGRGADRAGQPADDRHRRVQRRPHPPAARRGVARRPTRRRRGRQGAPR